MSDMSAASVLEQVHDAPERRIPAERSLRANTVWTLAGNAAYALSQWGMLVVLAKLGSAAMVGTYALGLSVTAPIMLLLNLNLRMAQATDARGEYRFGDYLGLRLATVGIAFALIAAVALALYGGESATIILLVGAAKGLEAISDVFYGLWQRHERMDRIAVAMALKAVLSLLAFAGGVGLTHSLAGGVVSLAVVWAVLLVVYDAPTGRSTLASAGARGITPRWNAPTLGRLVTLTWPLGLSAMLVSLVSNIPRYFVESRDGAADLGLFAAMAYIMQAGGVVINSLAQSAIPRLSRYHTQSNRKAFLRLLGALLLIASVMGASGVIVALVAGRDILTLMYRPEYATRVDVFAWIMVAMWLSFLASFLGYALSAARRFKIQPLILTAEVVIAAAACAAWVPPHGILGAAFALCATMGFQVVTMGAAHLLVLRGPKAVEVRA